MIGAKAYEPLVAKHGVPCVIAGFEAVDVLQGILMLAKQLESGRAEVEISYDRAVYRQGNSTALNIMYQVFSPAASEWRGLGNIPLSGLAIKSEYERFDAEKKLGLERKKSERKSGCKCGEVLKGIITPDQCKLFDKTCRPEQPVGPCMVSAEGACAAFFRYGR
jgi:hydrogenase expression/formation protein HypD